MTTDYHDFVDLNTPLEERRRLDVGDWYINSVLCLKCGDEPRSKNRHDFASCRCGAVSVDGGSWYLKRNGEPSAMQDRSVMFNDVPDRVAAT